MASVAFPATTAAATAQADGTATATGTASTDPFAALFQSVLTAAVAQANAANPTTQLQAALAAVQPHAAKTPATNGTGAALSVADIAAQLQAALAASQGATPKAATDILAQLIGQTAQTGTADKRTSGTVNADATATTDDKTNTLQVNADLLSQLLAAFGANAPLVPQQAIAPSTTTATPAAVGTASPDTVAVLPVPATVAPVVQQLLDRTAVQPLTKPVETQLPTATVPAAVASATDIPTAAPQTADRAAAVSVSLAAVAQSDTKATQPITVSAANRAAARAPVVLQTPVSTDGSQVPPPAPVPIQPTGIPSPVAEISAAKATAPVGVEFAVPRAPAEVAPKPATPPTAGTPAVFAAAAPVAQPTPTTTAPPTAPIPTATGSVATPVARPSLAAPAQTQSVAVAVPTTEFTKLLSASLAPPAVDDALDDVPATATGVSPQPRFETVAAAPVEQSAAPAPTAPTVADQLTGPIVTALHPHPAAGETTIQIRLDPPELGAVKLKIVSTGGEVRAELHVSSDAVRRVVESQLPQLQQKLDDAGVKVQRFDVTADPNGGASGGPANGERGRWRTPDAPEPPPPAYRPARPSITNPVAHRVDLSA